MADTGKLAADILGLRDEQFHKAPASLVAALEARAVPPGFEGVLLNAPKKVDVEAAARLPLLSLVLRSGRREAALPYRENCSILAVDADDRVYMGRAFPPRVASVPVWPPPDPEEMEPPAEDEMPDTIRGFHVFDARERLALPWCPGHWRFTLLYHDERSNTACVELVGRPEERPSWPRTVDPPHPDPAAISAWRQGGEPVFPWYLPSDRSPDPPDDGVRFSLVRRPSAEVELALFGSFAAPVRASWRLPVPQRHDLGPEGDRLVAAVVPLTLAVARKNRAPPHAVEIRVPVYADRVEPESRSEGWFSVDVSDLVSGEYPIIPPGTEFRAFMILGGRMLEASP